MNRLSRLRISIPVYVIAISVVAAVLLVGWVARYSFFHGRELSAQQEQTRVFLAEEVCGRLVLRDEIFIHLLRVSERKWRPVDPDFADELQQAIAALLFTTSGCAQELPE